MHAGIQRFLYGSNTACFEMNSRLRNLNRRSVMNALPLLLAGCASSGRFSPFSGGDYGALQDGPFVVPAISIATLDPSLLRQEVAWRGYDRPGSIIVVVPERRLYVVQRGGRALRYAVGVGRAEALNFHGSAVIGRKEKWPSWTPTAHMMATMPPYKSFANGMDGGLENPLGARALYLYREGHDTFFRFHGTNEPQTIGRAVSSGCLRLFNQDIIDLYDRIPIGTHVMVVQGERGPAVDA